MALVQNVCENPDCGKEFIGRPNKKFCSPLCRQRKYLRETVGPDPDRTARGRSNRARGAAAERDVCAIINAITGGSVSRNLSQTRDAGSDVRWGPFMLEVKYQRTYALPGWQRQVEVAANDADLVPAVVYRRPGEKFWVSLPFETFVMMFETLRRAAESGIQDGKQGH